MSGISALDSLDISTNSVNGLATEHQTAWRWQKQIILTEVWYLKSLKNIHFGVLEMIGFPNGIIDFGSLWSGVWACSRCCNFLENPPLRLNIGNKPHGRPRPPPSGPSNFLLAPYDSKDRLHTKKCKDLILNC